jgi:uncharacterized protein (TIGR02466 family)
MTKEKKVKIEVEKCLLWEESYFHVSIPDIDNKRLIEFYYETLKKTPEGVRNSNIGGYQEFIDRSECKELEKVLRRLESSATRIYNEGFKNERKLVVSNVWFNGNLKCDYNHEHTHPGAILSGVYYITDSTEENGEIHFSRPNSCSVNLAWPGKQEQIGASAICFNVGLKAPCKASEALLFAPWIRHGVGVNRTDDLRLVLGLNFTFADEDNDEDESTNNEKE